MATEVDLDSQPEQVGVYSFMIREEYVPYIEELCDLAMDLVKLADRTLGDLGGSAIPASASAEVVQLAFSFVQRCRHALRGVILLAGHGLPFEALSVMRTIVDYLITFAFIRHDSHRSEERSKAYIEFLSVVRFARMVSAKEIGMTVDKAAFEVATAACRKVADRYPGKEPCTKRWTSENLSEWARGQPSLRLHYELSTAPLKLVVS